MDLHGIGVGRGGAVGPVLRMPEPLPEPADVPRVRAAAAELEAVVVARAAVAERLIAAGNRVGGDAAGILEATAMMAEDPTLIDDVRARIEAGATGERAVFDAFAAFQRALNGMGGRFAERSADLGDVARRIVAGLRGVPAPGIPDSDVPFVLVARDLAPADMVQLDASRVLGLVTQDGGPTSHTAVLARAKSLPMIVAVAGALDLSDGDMVIVDAAAGVVHARPTEEELRSAGDRARRRAAISAAPLFSGRMADDMPVPLLATLNSPDDAPSALESGAEGVGLFRTEFLFPDSEEAPSVADQAARYTELLRHFPGRRVVARCFDAGGDKPLRFLSVAHGENPALGMRGLRALRANEAVLRDQLTALAQAQAVSEAELWVMAPIVSDAEEAEYFVRLGHELGLVTVGVMAEVPSIAVVMDQVFEVADFVSVGTNDLTQYTLAADRQLGSVAKFQDPWHPAVLRLIKQIGDAGAAAGKPVGVCGEGAADPQLAVVLVGLGAKTLGMTPGDLAEVRAELAKFTLPQARAMAARALRARTAEGAREAALCGVP